MSVKHPEHLHVAEFFRSHVPGLGELLGKDSGRSVRGFSGRAIRPADVRATTSSATHTRLQLYTEVIRAEVLGIERRLKAATGKSVSEICNDKTLSLKHSEDLHRRELLLDEVSRASSSLKNLGANITRMSKSVSTQSPERN